ncbi:MAG: enoyl-CoA hydratase-related protein [Myxococcota bacterium]
MEPETESEMELKTLLLEREDRVAWITLHRPHRLNAWTGRMHTEYRWLLEQLDGDPDVGVIVVTGAGRGFCAGADAKALSGHVEKGGYDPGTPARLARPGHGVRDEFEADFAYQFGLSKPMIAAINGPAAGVGLVLACFCDLRFAARGAVLTTAHGKLGLPAEFGLSWLLPRIVGLTHANDWLLTSRRVSAEEAKAAGLLNDVFEPEALRARVSEFARELATSVSPASLRETKGQIYTDLHRDVGSSVRHANLRIDEMMREVDYREGVAALQAKRPPAYPVKPGGDEA